MDYKFSIFATPGNLDGTDMTVAIPDGVTGASLTRTVDPGDIVAVILPVQPYPEAPYAAAVQLREVVAGAPWPLCAVQPKTGDILVSTAPVSQQSQFYIGSAALCIADGVVCALDANAITYLTDRLQAQVDALNAKRPSHQDINGPNVYPWDGTDNTMLSADTSAGGELIVNGFPDAASDTGTDRTLIVYHRWAASDGTSKLTVQLPVDSDIVNVDIPQRVAATFRSIFGAWVLTSWAVQPVAAVTPPPEDTPPVDDGGSGDTPPEEPPPAE